MSLLERDEFSILTGFAKAVANHCGDPNLQPRHFVAAAWISSQKGHLISSPTLDAHIKAHGAVIRAFLKSEGISGLEAVATPVPAEIQLSLDDSLRAMIAQANVKDAGLIDFLNELFLRGIQLAELEAVAYHEAGHAVVSLLLRPEVRLGRATIEREGNAAGSVSFMEKVSRGSQEDFLERMCIAIAGQVAQVRKFGATSADAGAVSDFHIATTVAWDYITSYGLDPQFGPIILDALKEKGIASGWLFEEAQRRLQVVLKEAHAKTVVVVDTHWDKVERVARLLLKKMTITEEEIRAEVAL